MRPNALLFTLLLSVPARAETLDDALVAAHRCTTETAWAEQGPSGEWHPVCGDASGNPTGTPPPPEQQPGLCGLYAEWAYSACLSGYGEHVGWCYEAADEALEECGGWQ
jgi:hypothetical protein